jgi:hypothetical protein
METGRKMCPGTLDTERSTIGVMWYLVAAELARVS